DTNVLVYAEANDEPAKQQRALALLRELKLSGEGVLSTQVLQEYCNVGLRKLGLDPTHLRLQLASLARYDVVQVDADSIADALDLHAARSLSFFDALIVACAQRGGCEVLYSEDLQHGERIGPVRIENPFA